jgi:hypothetical protein
MAVASVKGNRLPPSRKISKESFHFFSMGEKTFPQFKYFLCLIAEEILGFSKWKKQDPLRWQDRLRRQDRNRQCFVRISFFLSCRRRRSCQRSGSCFFIVEHAFKRKFNMTIDLTKFF